MRVLITGRSFASFRGRELGLFEEDQARALMAFGHDVRFAAMDTRSARRFRPLGYGSYESRGLRVYVCAVPASGLPTAAAAKMESAAATRLWREVTADGWMPEVVHGHFGAWFAPLAREHHIPFVYTEHFSGRNRILPVTEAAKLKEEYARFDCLLAVSGALRENIRRNTGMNARVVPNIVDLDTFRYRRLAHTGFRFVTAANLIPIKGLDTLLRAVALSGLEDARLTVFGDGPERAALTALAGELGITGRVRLPGACSRETLAEEYARSDCFVLSSRSETFGLACVEALSAGLPVIATRCGGPEDFVAEDNGLLVPVDDVTALAEAMREMHDRAAMYDGASIARTTRERFSPSSVAGELTAIYRELTEGTTSEREIE